MLRLLSPSSNDDRQTRNSPPPLRFFYLCSYVPSFVGCTVGGIFCNLVSITCIVLSSLLIIIIITIIITMLLFVVVVVVVLITDFSFSFLPNYSESISFLLYMLKNPNLFLLSSFIHSIDHMRKLT